MRFSSMGGGDFHGSISPPFLCFTLFCLLLLSNDSASPLPEKFILLELKSSISYPSGVLSTWISSNTSDDLEHCSWYSVICGFNSRVSALKIGDDGRNWGFGGKVEKVPFVDGINGSLIGVLPSVVAKLTEIRVLSLPFHEFTGEIPAEIWGLLNLEALNLQGNSLTGNLPVSFEGLTKLRVLNLGLNPIGGEIPDSLSRCVDLEVLNLAGNRFTGPIPNFIYSLPRLSKLHLSSNSLKGTIPRTFGELRKLQVLDISRNILTGPIPAELGNCTDLSVLILSGWNGKGNSFQGSIPTEITSLSKLKVI